MEKIRLVGKMIGQCGQEPHAEIELTPIVAQNLIRRVKKLGAINGFALKGKYFIDREEVLQILKGLK